MQFLGHLVTRHGVKPNPVKTLIIQDWPTPTSPRELASFLGLAQYFSKFIPCYAIMTTCLRALMRETAVWKWTEQCENAFQDVKKALATDPVLATPDPDLPFEVIVDACQTGVGAVLMQDNRPVAFAGRQLNSAETRYHTTDQELLAVMFALQHWRCYLQGAVHPFTLVTDHHPNTYLNTQPTLSRRQARWSEKLQEYDFLWQYKPGSKNIADPVSRSPALQPSCLLLHEVQLLAASMPFDWVTPTRDVTPGLAMAFTADIHYADPVLASAHARYVHLCAISAVTTRSQQQGGKQAAEQPKAVPAQTGTHAAKPGNKRARSRFATQSRRTAHLRSM